MELLWTIRTRRRRWLLKGLLDARTGAALWVLTTSLFYLVLRAIWTAPGPQGFGRIGLSLSPNSALQLGGAFLLAAGGVLGCLAVTDPHWADLPAARKMAHRCWRRRMVPLAAGSACNLLGTAGLVLLAVRRDAAARSEYIALGVGLAGLVALGGCVLRGARYRARHSRDPHQDAWNTACGYMAATAGLGGGLAGHAMLGLVL